MNRICVNGKLHDADTPVLTAANRAYRYGNGLFETIRWTGKFLPLIEYHLDRLLQGMDVLKYQLPAHLDREKIHEEIIRLCVKNHGTKPARVRFSVFPGNGGLYDGDRKLQYVIETWPLSAEQGSFNNNGLLLGIYPDESKKPGIFSGLKSADFLLYSMAATYASEQKWNEALVLNPAGRIADSTIANIFIVKNGIICTPPVADGCVAGVMRRYLLDHLPEAGFTVEEQTLSPGDLDNAVEIFLTNAIRGIRWVGRYGDHTYPSEISAHISRTLVQTIFS